MNLLVSIFTRLIETRKKFSNCKRSLRLAQYFSRSIPVGRSMSSVITAPNILVYNDERKGLFRNIALNLLKCLHPDKYVVYNLTKSQVLTTPWKENAALLVVCCNEIDESVAEAFRSYMENSGKIMTFASNFNAPKSGLKCSSTSFEGLAKINYKNIENALVFQCKYSYSLANSETLATNIDNQPVILKAVINGGILIVSAVHLTLDSMIMCPTDIEKQSDDNDQKRLSILRSLLEDAFGLEVYSFTQPAPTAGYIIAENERGLPESLHNMNEIPLGKISQPGSSADVLVLTDIKVPLLLESQAPNSIIFDKNAYFSKLKSNTFGRTVVFFPVITSTMVPAEHLSSHEGIVIIASRQISGRGRGNNVWISPEGCAMFTLHFSLCLASALGQRMSVIQHMATLAVVHGIKKIPAYENLDFRLKWPNDLYLGRDTKIGGVLVNTTILGNNVHAHVGIGINVSNHRPTVCINSAIESHNTEKEDNLPLLKVEEVIAYTLNELEWLINEFTKSGPSQFLTLYYTYWLHKDQRVTLSSLNKQAIIQGIDDYGFLRVQTEDGKQLSLQPDGNRFDIMKNLIIARE